MGPGAKKAPPPEIRGRELSKFTFPGGETSIPAYRNLPRIAPNRRSAGRNPPDSGGPRFLPPARQVMVK